MFNPGGQIDLFHTVIVYGGGKGGGSSDSSKFESKPITLTDPVNGKTFVQETNPFLVYQQNPTGAPMMSAQDQLNAEITQRQADEKAASDAAQAKSDATAAQNESTFQTNRTQAYNDAMQNVIREFQLQGIDPNKYMASDITPTLQRAYNSIQDLSPNPSAAFPSSIASSILGDITSGARTQANTSLNQMFSPTYSQTALPDTLLNDPVNQILSEQFDPLSAQLTNAQKRGTLNDAGYQAAVDALNAKKTAAQSTLQNLGQNILTGDRSDLDTLISGAHTAASNLSAADTWDPSVYGTQASGKVASDVSGFGGALRSAVGDTQFATLADLLNAGGAVQGATNPTATNPTAGGGAVAPADDPNAAKRGLGNTGAF